MLPVEGYHPEQFILMATTNGTVKKTPLLDFSRPRSSGLIAIELEEGNTLVGASITDGQSDIMLFSSGGRAIRFKEDNVRAMGRGARGVRGIKLRSAETVIALIVPDSDGVLLLASENGYGKRTTVDQFSVIGRGGQGVICMKLSDRNGALVGAAEVGDEDEVILISDQGTLVRTRVSEVSTQGRNTQGVRLINLSEGEALVGVASFEEPEEGVQTEGLDVDDGEHDGVQGLSAEQAAAERPAENGLIEDNSDD